MIIKKIGIKTIGFSLLLHKKWYLYFRGLAIFNNLTRSPYGNLFYIFYYLFYLSIYFIYCLFVYFIIILFYIIFFQSFIIIIIFITKLNKHKILNKINIKILNLNLNLVSTAEVTEIKIIWTLIQNTSVDEGKYL